ncbi:integrase [Sulfolobus virus Kamchatka 1]|uniref:ORF F340 n=1 Tax=Sulfolobus virus Kamchatka 1 TaxID=248496 RepID=Q6TDM9_9VIRU|nr:integrase [Sulfolobus virus Kamchatka 1]AAQ94370.1 ORF F340 [Sulfolobus virus Kamchatka 1]
MPSFYVGSNFYIKEIKGKYYVYSIEKGEDNKQRHHYIAPLDKVIEFYISNGGLRGYPPNGGVGVPPTMGACRAPDPGSNPGRGAFLYVDSNNELKGVRIIDSNLTSSNNSEISASDLLKFELTLRQKNISEETIKKYISCVKQGRKESNNCIKAWRNFYRLVLNRDPPSELKPKKTKPDLKVPTLEEVRETLDKVKQYPSLYLLYRLLLESGSRLREALKLLNNYNPQNEIRGDGFSIYVLNWTRGQKKSFYLFHITELKAEKVTEGQITSAVRRLNLVPPKYIRKFVATKLFELGVSSEVVDFLEGRTPGNILTKHYLDLLTLAKKEYKKYAEWLKQII